MMNPYITQMANTFKAMNNSPTMLNHMLSSNPRLKQVMDYVNANGGDAQSAFYKLAKEKGIDPEEILSQLR